MFLSSAGKLNSLKFTKCFEIMNLENAIDYEMYGIPWKCFQEIPFFFTMFAAKTQFYTNAFKSIKV